MYQQTLKQVLVLSGAAIAGFIAFQVWHQYQDNSRIVADYDPAAKPVLAAESNTRRPEFELVSPDGSAVSAAQWKDQPLVVNFWATWCAPCRHEIPMLKELYAKHAADGLQLIGIALDSPEAVEQYARDMDINYPVLVGELDAMEVAEKFGLDLFVLPGTVFSLSDGRTLHRHVGELHVEQANAIIEILWQIEGEAIDFTQAQALLADLD